MYKTPDEIKKGLECCANAAFVCKSCPYYENCALMGGTEDPAKDGLVYIQRLESRLAQVERERDAAVYDLNFVKSCWVCENKRNIKTEHCSSCDLAWRNHFKWRGVCDENTKEEETHKEGEIR